MFTPTVLITGAGGYVGSRLTDRLLADGAFARWRLVLLDKKLPVIDDPRVTCVEGDLAEAAVLDRAFEALGSDPDIVFHLAGILGGAAETDYALARRVNVDGSLDLLERLRALQSVPRLVFASSIAVYGPPLPPFIDDEVIPRPTMTYGAQKLMIEQAVEQFSARGWIDGLAVRLPGIVARRDVDARQKSAFLNRVFYAAEAGETFTLPVSPQGTSWMLSVGAVINNLVHAALIPGEEIGRRRAFTLPAQVVCIGDLVDELERRFPQSRNRISYAPITELQAQFAAQPPLVTALSDALGFTHDGDLATLVMRGMEELWRVQRKNSSPAEFIARRRLLPNVDVERFRNDTDAVVDPDF